MLPEIWSSLYFENENKTNRNFQGARIHFVNFFDDFVVIFTVFFINKEICVTKTVVKSPKAFRNADFDKQKVRSKVRNHIEIGDQHFHDKAIDGKENGARHPNQAERIPALELQQIGRVQPNGLHRRPKPTVRERP